MCFPPNSRDRTLTHPSAALPAMAQRVRLPPEPPSEFDCCNSGCRYCVKDAYAEALRRYELGEDDLDKDGGANVALDALTFRPFTIVSITWCRGTSWPTALLSLALPAGKTFGARLGQHVWLRSRPRSSDILVTRPYTPISPPGASPIEFFIAVRPGGPMHEYLATLAAGDPVDLRGPGGSFEYRTNRWHRITLIAGGTGIAPLLQVVRGVLANDRDDTMMTLIWSTRTFADARPLAPALAALTEYVTFKRLFVASRETSAVAEPLLQPCVPGRRIDEPFFLEHVPPASGPRNAVLICGSSEFMTQMMEFAEQRGYSEPDTIVTFEAQ